MSILSSTEKFLKDIPSEIVKLEHSIHFSKAEHIAKQINDIVMKYGPVVKKIATETQNRTELELVKVLNSLDVPHTIDPTKPLSGDEVKGLLLRAASAAVKGQLGLAIADAGEVGLLLAGQYVKSLNVIPGSVIDSAAQIAYTFLVTASE